MHVARHICVRIHIPKYTAKCFDTFQTLLATARFLLQRAHKSDAINVKYDELWAMHTSGYAFASVRAAKSMHAYVRYLATMCCL